MARKLTAIAWPAIHKPSPGWIQTDELQRVHRFIERNQMILVGEIADRIAGDQSEVEPATPISTPCSMKILRICERRAPIDMRTAMSLYFSITIITRVMKILSAATISMSPMVIQVTIRSDLKAFISGLFCSCQVVAEDFAGDFLRLSWRLRRQVDVIELKFDGIDYILQARICCTAGREAKPNCHPDRRSRSRTTHHMET